MKQFYNSIQENPAIFDGDELNADMSSSLKGNPTLLAQRGRHKRLKFLIFFIFAISVFMFPRQALATPLGDIFSSPASLIVRIQERIEYFFAFNTKQKVVILDKQAERRLTRAENLVKTGDANKTLILIKSYEILKERQGGLIKAAPATVLTEVKERTVQQQARIEGIKKEIHGETKELIETCQVTIIKTMVDNIEAKEDVEEVTEFVKEIKNVIDPGSLVVLEFAREIAPGAFEISPGSLEVSPGTSETAPGSLETAPGQIAPGTKDINSGNSNYAP